MKWIKSYINKMRELEDEGVRRTVWENFGPLLRISNICGSMDEGWIYLSFIHAIILNFLMYWRLVIELYLPYFKITKRKRGYSYVYLFFVTCYLLKDDFVLFGVQFHYLLLALFGAIFTMFMYVRRGEFLFVMKTISEGFFDYANENLWAEEKSAFRNHMRKQRLKLIPFVILIGFIGFFIVVMGPLIDNMVGAGHKEDYLNGVYMKTPIPMYFPFMIDSNEKHYMAAGFQMVTVTMLALAISSVIFMYIVCAQNLAMQFKILIVSLKKLKARSRQLHKERYPNILKIRQNDPRYQECVEFCLKENAKHLQKIREFYRVQGRLIEHLLLASFLMGTGILALSMIILVEKSDRIGLLITNTLAMSGEIGNLYIACSFGEDIKTLSEELFDSVYAVDWPQMNQKNKKLIISLQDCTRSPTVIKASLFFTCSMDTFSSICNSAYSYFNMLTASSTVSKEIEE